ncbi:MAG: competence protein CoiA family protein [Liquorilactobacillus ghanensis]|uniref:competence protein CoiA n=1 Tax=Liquorilactobacillus ghanensis TaxID=399370 RepID=UPI0039E79864
MLVGQQINGKLIDAAVADVTKKYYCPVCHQRLILKKGNLRIAHFAHSTVCILKYGEPETREHLTGKLQLQQNFAFAGYKGQLEQYLPELQQRPDLLLKMTNGKTLAIEYQCAPLTVQQLYQRTQGYRKHGIRCWWILGENHWLKKKITQQEAQFMMWHPGLGFYLVYYFPKRQHFCLLYQIQQADFLNVSYLKFITNDVKKLQIFMRTVTKPVTLSVRLRTMQRRNFEKACCFYRGSLFVEQLAWYEKKINFRLLGLELLEFSLDLPIFAEKQIVWQSRLLRLNDWPISEINSFQNNTEILTYQLPLIKNNNFVSSCLKRFKIKILQSNLIKSSKINF